MKIEVNGGSGGLISLRCKECGAVSTVQLRDKAIDWEHFCKPQSSWLDNAVCGICQFAIVITQSRTADYWYYCSNKFCHNRYGEQLGDQEETTLNKGPIAYGNR